MKALLVIMVLGLSLNSLAFEAGPDFNSETARDVLQGMEPSEEFIAAKEELMQNHDRPLLTDEEAAMMLLSQQPPEE